MSPATDRQLSPFATALKQARLGKSLSVADFARLVQLSDTQVTGLETDDLRAFYSAAFALRAARRCAEFLGVDPSLEGAPVEVVAERVEAQPPPAAPFPVRPGFSLKPSWIAAGVAALVSLAVGVYLARTPRSAAVVAATASVPEPAPEPSLPVPVAAPVVAEPVEPVAEPTPPVVAPARAAVMMPSALAATVPDDADHRFYLVVTREVSIHARDASGSEVISGSLMPDKGQRVVGNPPFAVAVSDEDAVEIYYKGSRVRTERNNNQGVSLTVNPGLR